LGSTVLAEVAEVLATEGETVKAATLLVRLKDAEQVAQVAQAEAALAKARARLSQMGGVVRRIAEHSSEQAQAELERARTELERTTRLVEAGSATQAALDDVRTSFSLASTRARTAELEQKSAGPGGSEYAGAAAALGEAEALLKAAHARLDATRIVAPSDGVVLRRDAEPGDVVQPGRPLIVLARAGATRLSVQAEERNLVHLRVGQSAVAVADALPALSFAARVSYIAPAVDAERGTIELRLDVPDPPSGLRPDMTVSVNLEIGRLPDALILPARSVHDAATERPWVLVVKDGRIERRTVRVGVTGDGVLEISDGLGDRDEVVLSSDTAHSSGKRVRTRFIEGRDAL
jgi:HlyD family secretion protein